VRGDHIDTYAGNAGFWVTIIREQLDRYRIELTDPAVLAAVGDCAGHRILDGGCGEGYMSRALAARGATVTGLDISDSLIDTARSHELTAKLDVTYYVASLEKIPEADCTFDVAVCNHVISDVVDPRGAFKELGRIIKPGGRLVILMLHPCFYTAHSERDPHGNLPVTDYFSARRVDQTFKVAGLVSPDEVHMMFRPLEFYISAIVDAGFSVVGLTEPHPSAEVLREDEWWRTNFVKPLFMLISAARSC